MKKERRTKEKHTKETKIARITKKKARTEVSSWRWCLSCVVEKSLKSHSCCRKCAIRIAGYFKFCNHCKEKHVISEEACRDAKEFRRIHYPDSKEFRKDDPPTAN